jgi:hypothetical protein
LFLRSFNQGSGCGKSAIDSKADFSSRNDLLICWLIGQRREPGRSPMTIVSRLSVVTAYVAFAFVGAIVLGMI